MENSFRKDSVSIEFITKSKVFELINDRLRQSERGRISRVSFDKIWNNLEKIITEKAHNREIPKGKVYEVKIGSKTILANFYTLNDTIKSIGKTDDALNYFTEEALSFPPVKEAKSTKTTYTKKLIKNSEPPKELMDRVTIESKLNPYIIDKGELKNFLDALVLKAEKNGSFFFTDKETKSAILVNKDNRGFTRINGFENLKIILAERGIISADALVKSNEQTKAKGRK